MTQRSLGILAIVAIVWLLQYAEPVLVPVVLAVLISYVLEPVVAKLQRLRIPRVLGAAVVLLCAIAIIGSGVYVMTDDVLEIVGNLPAATNKLRQTFKPAKGGEGVVEKVKEAATAIEKTAEEATAPAAPPKGVTRVQVEEKAVDLSGLVVWGSMGVLSWAGSLLLLTFLIYFLLISGNLFRDKLIKIAGHNQANRRLTVEILDEINAQIGRWVLVQLFTASVVAAASFAAFRFMGLERAGIWGMTAGILNTIPYFGPLIVSAALAVVALIQFGTIEMAIYIALVALAITSVEGYLLTPYIAGRAVRMNGVALFIGLLFWTWLWQAWGVVLAIPMMVIMKSVCDRVDGLKPIGELMGE